MGSRALFLRENTGSFELWGWDFEFAGPKTPPPPPPQKIKGSADVLKRGEDILTLFSNFRNAEGGSDGCEVKSFQ